MELLNQKSLPEGVHNTLARFGGKDHAEFPDFTLSPVNLEQILQCIPGEEANVADIYPLTPLQEGILFHHLMNEDSDPYILSTLLEMASRAQVDALIGSLQRVIDRHDILRTGVVWKQLSSPVQVVCKQARMPVIELTLDPSRDAVEQLKARMTPQSQRWNLWEAPLVRLQVIEDSNHGRWYAILQIHHVICDHGSLRMLVAETIAYLKDNSHSLAVPHSYRNYVSAALASANADTARAYFQKQLAGLSEPTAPFDLLNIVGDGSSIREARSSVDRELASRVRCQAKRLGVTPARMFHTAWALVVSMCTGRDDVVFGTVLLSTDHRRAEAKGLLGVFINILPLRIRLADVSVLELLEQVQDELRELLRHEHASLAVAQRCSAIPGGSPLFTAILNYRHSVVSSGEDWSDAEGIRVVTANQYRTNYPITLTVENLGNGFDLIAQTDHRIEPHRITHYLEHALVALVEAIECAPQTLALELAIMPNREWQQIVREFNSTVVSVSPHQTVHGLFSEWVRRAPGSVAVTCGGEALTYFELDHRSDRLAHALSALHVRSNDRILVLMERGIEMVIALLAALKSGAAYVPVDVSYPAERVRYIVKDSAPAIVLTESKFLASLPPSSARVLSVDRDWREIRSLAEGGAPRSYVSSQQLAYVIYTSGSTGVPKGVMVSHGNLMNLVDWHCRTFHLAEGRRGSSVAATGFDAAVWEIWPPLSSGGTLVLAPQGLNGDVDRLLEWWVVQALDVSFLPTPIAQIAWSRGSTNASLRTLLVGGDRLTCIPRAGLPNVVNNYGPTESTVVATSGFIAANETALHIGSPISNTHIYILNRRTRPVPIGVPGEIYIGGASVAQGYLNRPELTAERFMADPFSTGGMARMYKTGDMARWRPNGTIEYLGRNDAQVKVRGNRVELGEVESVLLEHPAVTQAVVLARETSTGNQQLVAYVACEPRPVVPTTSIGASKVEWDTVARESEQSDAPSESLLRQNIIASLRKHLRSRLPEYMVPTAWMVLKHLPLTENGKVDRQALPLPPERGDDLEEYIGPRTAVERVLADIWIDLLSVGKVGIRDNFFGLGGHSLLIAPMLERLRRAGLSTSARTVYENATLESLAGRLNRIRESDINAQPRGIPPETQKIAPEMLSIISLTSEEIEVITRAVPGGAVNIQDIYPLTPTQEGMLFHHLYESPGGDAYARALLLELPSRDALDTLVSALDKVVTRHDVLRTAMLWEHLSKPVQVVYRHAKLSVVEIRLDAIGDTREQLRQRMNVGGVKLDLRRAPIMSLEIATDSTSGHWFAVLHSHHLVFDNESLQTLFEEIATCVRSSAIRLPAPSPYRNYVAATLSCAANREAEVFFRKNFADVDEPTAPFGLVNVTCDGREISQARQAIEPGLAQRIRAMAQRLRVTPATVFHAAWALVAARTSGRDDVVFGSVLSGRIGAAAVNTHRSLGIFINTLPLRIKVIDQPVEKLILQTHSELVELLNHELAALSLAQRCSGIPGSAPLFTSVLNYMHRPADAMTEFAKVTGAALIAVHGKTNYPLLLSVYDQGQEFLIEVDSDRELDPARVSAYVVTALQALVDAVDTGSMEPVSLLSIVPEHEQRLLTKGFNTTQVKVPEKTVHQLFEEQVRRAPDATAVVYEGRTVTYQELNVRANQLARCLKARGIVAEQLVGICVERSLEMVVGLLGILKCGGAYVPVEPHYPKERLQYMLDDVAPRILLIQNHLRARLPRTTAELIELDSGWSEIQLQDKGDLDAKTLGIHPRQLAYVIYTSGSTGQPKGAMNEHRGVVNRLQWMQDQYELGHADAVLQKTPFSFDVSVWEFFWTLLSGARLIIARPEGHKDPVYLMQLIEEMTITTLHFVPSMLQMFLDHYRLGRCPSLRHVVCSGEELPASLQKRFFECFPHARLSNLYGPTEAAVDVTGWECNPQDEGNRVPIGRPISNIQMYVLDRNGRPAPIGVAGEIYIGGLGVGRGYLKRAELTGERFVANPFSTDSQARMYKTGDLGRWRLDGAIEYIGRNDHQVKIRGFRIELGEIEAQLALHAQVKEAAVLAREDVPGEKRLVAYVTAREPVGGPALSVEGLRSHLKQLLPEHMIPSAFVIQASFPLSPNGKLDRRALLPPERAGYATLTYVAPSGELEERLAGIWQDLLHVQPIDRFDNFFGLGGHSILALQLVMSINKALSVNLTISDLYRHPSLSELALLVGGKSKADERVILSREATFSLDSRSAVTVAEDGSVILTGCTGFVGRYVLAQLLENTQEHVFCLVRARTPEEAVRRLNATMSEWDLWKQAYDARITAVPCDLRIPRLGIDERTYDVLCNQGRIIYHCAVRMNHLETYAMTKQENVESAKELLRLATTGRGKVINHISTLSIFTSVDGNSERSVDEDTPIEAEEHWESQGYAASKWVSEKLFIDAGKAGIPCNIFRLGLVWADSQKGRYDPLQREYRIFKTCLLSGYGIRGYRYSMPPIPVDYVARSIVTLGEQHTNGLNVFHIVGSTSMNSGLFERSNAVAGTALKLLSFYEWIREVKRLHYRGQSLPSVPLVEFAFDMDEQTFNRCTLFAGPGLLHFSAARTEKELLDVGIIVPGLSDFMLRLYVRAMLERDKDLKAYRFGETQNDIVGRTANFREHG